VRRLVAVEAEPPAAGRLAERFARTNVEVATGDAAALDYPDASFEAARTLAEAIGANPELRAHAGGDPDLAVLREGGLL